MNIKELILLIGVLVLISFLTTTPILFLNKIEVPIVYIIDGEEVSCNNVKISYCGASLRECDNDKEYRCVTNLIEVKK
jgi:hypothetical protein